MFNAKQDFTPSTLCVVGVTGLVTTDERHDRNTDFTLWAMTNQQTGQYGVRKDTDPLK